MGLSRRIKFKFKFTRKYNTNVYNFFTKKKSTRRVFEQKQVLNLLQVEKENLKIKLPVLMQTVSQKKQRQQKSIFQRKTKINLCCFNLKQKAKSLSSILMFIQRKYTSQFLFFFPLKNTFFYKRMYSNFFFKLILLLFNQVREGNFQQYKKKVVEKKNLRGVTISNNVRVTLKKIKKNFFKLGLNKTIKNQLFFYSFNVVSMFRKLHRLILLKTRCFNFLILQNSFVDKKKVRIPNSLREVNFKLFKLESLASKFKLKSKFLNFINTNKNKKFNYELHKREAFELSWFFYDLLRTFYLYEKLQFDIYKNFRLLFLMLFPILSSKIKPFLIKTFFKSNFFLEFKYNQKAPRVFEFFFSKLQKKYGFKAIDVPFRLDVPLPRYKLKKQTEKLEMYRLLKITRRYYGHLNRKVFWKIRKKVYNKTKGYAFFNQLLLYESRLDLFLVRAQLCNSLQDARNFIYKGWICVNGKQIHNFNYIVSLTDIVSICAQKMLVFKHFFLNKTLRLLQEYSTTIGKIFPKYLESNFLNMSFCYVPKVFSIEKIPEQFASLKKVIVPNWGKFAY